VPRLDRVTERGDVFLVIMYACRVLFTQRRQLLFQANNKRILSLHAQFHSIHLIPEVAPGGFEHVVVRIRRSTRLRLQPLNLHLSDVLILITKVLILPLKGCNRSLKRRHLVVARLPSVQYLVLVFCTSLGLNAKVTLSLFKLPAYHHELALLLRQLDPGPPVHILPRSFEFLSMSLVSDVDLCSHRGHLRLERLCRPLVCCLLIP
jgi:hypothetical protein